jgi:carbamoyl-phosphate synthase large subunit
MRSNCRVMVTGAGSGVGQGIVKALRVSSLPVTVVAADIAPMNAALYRADEAVLIPRVELPNALTEILDLLEQHKIDVIMVGSEFDLSFFSANKAEIESHCDVIVVVAPLKTVAIAEDKWLTAEFLRKNDLPYAEAFLPNNLDDAARVAEVWGYPVVLKMRRGTSSRHVHIVKTHEELMRLYPKTPFPMLQQVIDIPSSQLGREYTCSIFKTNGGRMIGPFTARRTLRGGTSWHIEVADFKELHAPLLAIASAIDYIGSLNVQLMVTERGAIPFEFNARFSGTTAVRAHFGFNEPAMALLSFFYKEEVTTPSIRFGMAMRYHEEVFVEEVSAAGLSLSDTGVVNTWF